MGSNKSSLRLLVSIVFALSLVFTVKGVADAETAVLYTRYNLHVETQERNSGAPVYVASYANYIYPPSGLLLLPPNTRILVAQEHKPYRIEILDKNIQVVFEYHPGRMKMDFDQYIKKIASPKPVDLKGLTALDKKGVEEGRALIGMTKRGVMTALGYPAAHRTPSLESNLWTYWKDRYRTFRVQFGTNGKVVEIVE